VGTAQTVCFAVATATIVLPLFAPQPLVGIIAASFGLSSWAIGAAATVTLLGYATGLFLLTPLTDLLETRRVILTTVIADVFALAAAAAAPSAAAFFSAAFVIGTMTSAIQMLVPAAAILAPELQRGRVIGNVVSGLMIGILLSRPIGKPHSRGCGLAGLLCA
jgi:predicted MFS family arabinose efflux permease